MKSEEINKLSDKEIALKLKETREELLGLRVRKQTGQVEKPHKLKELRKLVARLETALTVLKKKAA